MILDIKPWDDERDVAKLEECIRSIQADGLFPGSSTLVPGGYTIKKTSNTVCKDDSFETVMLKDYIHGCGCFQQDIKSIKDHCP